jgi:hypothetical protein
MAEILNKDLLLFESILQWQKDQNYPVEINWFDISQKMIEKSLPMTPYGCYGLWMSLAYQIDLSETETIQKDEVRRIRDDEE